MDAALFLADLEAKPAALARLAQQLTTGGLVDLLDETDTLEAPRGRWRRIVLLGMGSSLYAAQVAARRLRAAGVDAVADHASAASGWPSDPRTLVVAVSASGASAEVLDALTRLRDGSPSSPVLALTEVEGSAVTHGALATQLLHAGVEVGGVACRSFQHTGLLLHALADMWSGVPRDAATARAVALTRQVAQATQDLLERRDAWLPAVLEHLDGPDGLWTLAPVERLSSAQQSALMVREGPRRQAAGCETGDWSHVDVYLTRTLDYRALMFTGSRYDAAALDWMAQRGSRLVAVGRDAPAAAAAVPGTVVVRHVHDDADVALHTETLVAELVAATWWADQTTTTSSSD